MQITRHEIHFFLNRFLLFFLSLFLSVASNQGRCPCRLLHQFCQYVLLKIVYLDLKCDHIIQYFWNMIKYCSGYLNVFSLLLYFSTLLRFKSVFFLLVSVLITIHYFALVVEMSTMRVNIVYQALFSCMWNTFFLPWQQLRKSVCAVFVQTLAWNNVDTRQTGSVVFTDRKKRKREKTDRVKHVD